MRRGRALVFATILLGGIGCARTLPLTDYDRCGLQGMELEGVQMSEARHDFGGPTIGVGRRFYTRPRGVLQAASPRKPGQSLRGQSLRGQGDLQDDNKRRSDAALEEVANASVVEWQRVYRSCMAGAG